MAPRSFYADDEVQTKPGFNQEITPELAAKESLHNVSYIDGHVVRTTSYLESVFNNARKYVLNKYDLARYEILTLQSSAANELLSLQQKWNDVHDVKEEMLPVSIIVLTATLFGSVISAKRMLPIRFLTPIATGLVAANYAAPNTFENLVWNFDNSKWQLVVAHMDFTQHKMATIEQSVQKNLQEEIHNIRKMFK